MSDLWKGSTHVWKKNDYDEEMDVFAGTDSGYHNGPLCVVCGYTACMHCVANPEPCTGPRPKSKNIDLLRQFYAYCHAHPEERFWQALRNWSGQQGIMAVVNRNIMDDNGMYDTWEWVTRDGR